MRRLSSIVSFNSLERGFTIVELTIVIVALAILTGLTIGSTNGFQESARDAERAADIDAISRNLESNYRTQSVAVGATYPATSVGAAGFTSIVTDAEVLNAPDTSTNSIVIANAAGPQNPNYSQYIYQPLTIDGMLCNATPCAKYKLYYRLEKTGAIIVKDSMRQQ